MADANGHFVIADVSAGQYALPGFQRGADQLRGERERYHCTEHRIGRVKQLKNITVVANRYDASNLKMNAVSTVDVLSADDLQHTAVHHVAEALGLISGINITTTGSGYFGGVDGAARGGARAPQRRRQVFVPGADALAWLMGTSARRRT